ncbi:aminotransferase [Crepidotus variabilis]|uniref:Aminotransferase n=1 Tax=Crepidotus variabilis TaxID=179855 RepID=A0A9P6EMR4_9AGAR|nr:aminotransferase [Crepidotus variabilis]
MSSSGYQLLTSTRFDPALKQWPWNNLHGKPCPVFLIEYHRDRLKSASEIHQWPLAHAAIDQVDLAQMCLRQIDIYGGSKDSPHRLRITVTNDGEITIVASPLPSCFDEDPMLPLVTARNSKYFPHTRPVQILIDTQATETSLFTRTKTTFRSTYDNAKGRNENALKDISHDAVSDVLLFNTENQIMETTIYNVAFYRNSRWITPSTSSGCLPGVLRRWLLEKGKIFQDEGRTLTRVSIKVGEYVLLFNGVQGCRVGVIKG